MSDTEVQEEPTGVLINEEKEASPTSVWKFGYGSNMSMDFLRSKKGLNPLECRASILKGFSLSFPEGKGIDFVEPCFATLKRDPNGVVHGASVLFPYEDKIKLDKQERGYNIEINNITCYNNTTLNVEVYVSKTPLALDFPEGA